MVNFHGATTTTMKDALLKCLKCGREFVAKIFEPGEAEHKNIPGYPVRCDMCGGEARKIKG